MHIIDEVVSEAEQLLQTRTEELLSGPGSGLNAKQKLITKPVIAYTESIRGFERLQSFDFEFPPRYDLDVLASRAPNSLLKL